MDSSVTISWLFEDEHHPYAMDVWKALNRATAVVPMLWHIETANTILVAERRKRTTKTKTAEILKLLGDVPIVVDEHTRSHVFDDMYSLARTYDLSLYDATYLELALRRDLPIATLDEKLKNAAKKAGVAIYRP